MELMIMLQGSGPTTSITSVQRHRSTPFIMCLTSFIDRTHGCDTEVLCMCSILLSLSAADEFNNTMKQT